MLRRFVSLSLPLVLLPTLGAAPTHAQLGPTQAVVVDFDTGTLSVVDAVTNSIVSSTNGLAPGIIDVAVTPDGTTALVTNANGFLSYVDLTTTPPSVSPETTDLGTLLALDVDINCSGTGYAVITGGSLDNQVFSVDLATKALAQNPPLSLDVGVQAAAISPDGSLVLAASTSSSVIRVLQMYPNGALMDTGHNVLVGQGPINVTISPDGQLALVANGVGSSVSVLDLSASPIPDPETSLTLAGAIPQSIAFSPAGNRAYVLGCGVSSIFALEPDSTGDWGVTDTFFRVGLTPPNCFFGVDQIAVSPDGSRLFARYLQGLSTMNSTSGDELANIGLGGNLGGGVATLCDAGTGTNLPPVITCNAPVELWSPQHDLVDIASAFSVQDPDAGPGDELTVSVRVFCDETEIPETGDGSGKHAPDFKDESGGRGLLVRSERRGNGDGRWYVLVITADDGQGGVTTVACGGGACPKSQSEESLADVMAQLDAAVADIQAALDAPMPLDQLGYYEHGSSAEMGPKQ